MTTLGFSALWESEAAVLQRKAFGAMPQLSD
jgi:hypothetical protein